MSMTTGQGPQVPKNDTAKELGFTRQPMVQWFSVPQLLQTGTKVLISSLFGAYEDKREIQAMLPVTDPPDYSNRKEIWIDYLADTGDGFNATYTMISLAAKAKLKIRAAKGDILKPRGKLLVLGGDEVYPTASRDAYNDKLIGPFKAALPWVEGDDTPEVFAVPGNHDWYDGLTSFIRFFCQDRWLGGWKTRQKRSYFAAKLPHGWWLWGIDVQLKSNVDAPQLEFFKNHATKYMQPGDKVILCTAEPSWAHQWTGDGGDFGNLSFIEKTLIRKQGLLCPLTLSGDLHHYSRYQQKGPGDKREDAGIQRITAGGGGAFMHSTQNLPETGTLVEGDGETVHYTRQAVYPSAVKSRLLALKAVFFFRGGKTYAALLGFIYWLLAWLVNKGSDRAILVTTLLFLFGVTYFLTDAKKKINRILISGAHWLVHIAAAWALMKGAVYLDSDVLKLAPTSIGFALSFSVLVFILGSLVAGTVVGCYLALCAWCNHQLGDAFSSIGIEDYKNMLKLHIDEQGGLNVYAIGVDTVCKNWVLNPDAKPGEPWFQDPEGKLDERAHLIDVPIRFDPVSKQWSEALLS